MAAPRLFVDAELRAGGELELRDEALHYARNVLRLEAGALLSVFDGRGHEHSARIGTIGKRALGIVLGEALPTPADNGRELHLGIGLSRGERMDWVVQKSTELGVSSITPLLLARCNARLDGERVDNRLRHWRQVAISACEQCGRARLPILGRPALLGQWLADNAGMPGLVLHTREARALPLSAAREPVRLLAGPEGGLEDAEFEQALGAGFSAWSLGPRILRTETAPVAALAILQFLGNS